MRVSEGATREARVGTTYDGHGAPSPGAITEGYIPTWSTDREPEMTNHETSCIPNTGGRDVNVEITLYFADRDPAGPYRIPCPMAERGTFASTS